VKTDTPDGAVLSAVDREALERALDMARKESPQQAAQIDVMIRERGWNRAAEFASYCCQDANLKLRPWQMPPVWLKGDPDVVLAGIDRGHRGGDQDYRGCRQAALLVKRLLAAGLSRFEPDPETALARKGPN
jgi:hypothetical protein